LEGQDFIATQGTLNIYPNKDHALVIVEVIADNIPEADETFYLDVFNTVGSSFGLGVVLLWSNADYLIRNATSANVLAKYRSKLSRMAIKMQREAMQLGECLDPPNKDAFLSLNATKAIAHQLG
jgi:hypothetical protein